MRSARRAAALALSALGAAVIAQAAPGLLAPLAAGTATQPGPPWRVATLPRQKPTVTAFDIVELEGQRVLRVRAEASYGNLVHALAPPPDGAAPGLLGWRWRLQQPLPRADLRSKAGDDAALKVCALFDAPLATLPFWERMTMRLARQAAGEELPSATLCYVWDPGLAPGTVLPNAYSARLRWLVLRGAGTPVDSWQAERRDLGADYRLAFGSGQPVPPLVGIAVGADADNTGGMALGYLADLVLQR